ncbi:MAG: T9SS type A sorting domain-containing protein [Bacteroidia bacterium]|nr:T9SS type A sorting domain-containing protein [Bacteroidia bacterium]
MDSTLMEYMREQAFYKMASENDEVLNQGVPEDADYQTKYNNLETNNTGEIAKADEEIAEGDYSTALARINALLDENTHEFNKMAVQEIYINYYAQDIEPDAGTKIQLENIAYSHPFYGGEGVYIARAMLGIDVEDAFPAARLANPNLQMEAEALKTVIYPNPANNLAYLHVEKSEEEKLTVEVNNVYGKHVYSTTNYNSLIELNTSAFVSGIYLVNVYIDDELKTTKKLTVLK